jgi:23S rRNA (adenine2503-C2)-methyltransferase
VKANDGTVKMLLRLADGLVVETVGIPADRASTPRLTVCVSSQVSRCTCKHGCHLR